MTSIGAGKPQALGQPSGRPPGRPRSERAEKAIIDATLDLLVEEAGVAGVTIEAVAARAGVGKTTIYRRWPNKEALIIHATGALKGPIVEPPGRSSRDDLVELARSVRPGGDRRADCLWSIFGSASKHPELARMFQQEVIEPRREVMRRVLRNGIERGEFRADLDVEVVISLIVGGVTMRARSYHPEEGLPEDYPERVVDTAISGLRPPGRPGPADRAQPSEGLRA